MENTIKHVILNLSEEQTKIILKSLELYTFNMHNVWGISKSEEEFQLKNALVFHTYEQIMSSVNTNFYYKSNYNIQKECEYIKLKTFYYNRRHSKKIKK